MAKVNEIWAKKDHNLTVLGLYPHQMPQEIRTKISLNHDKIFILIQNEKLFLLLECDSEEEATRRIQSIDDNLSYWLVHPLQEFATC